MTTHQTQCPSCQHLFDITDEQLKLKSGYARCGSCKSIFSAIDHLVSTINRTPIQPVPASAKPSKATSSSLDDLSFDNNSGLGLSLDTPPAPKAPSPSLPQSSIADFDIIENFDSLPNNKIGQSTQKKSNDDDAWLTDLLAEENRKEKELEQGFMPDMESFSKASRENDVSSMLDDLGINLTHDSLIEQDDYLQKIDQRFSQQVASQKNLKMPIGMMMVWLFGSLFLSGILAVQYVVFNLDTLLKNPETAEKIQTACELLKCNLPVANVSIIQTDTLSLNKAKQPNQSDLIFTLTNTTTQQVIYPNLKISLRDGNNVKAQLLLTPIQYLDDTNGYLMPNQIKAIKLRIDYPKASYSQANIEPFY